MGLRVILSRLSLKKVFSKVWIGFSRLFSLTDLPRIRQAESTQDDGVRTFLFSDSSFFLISYFGFYPIYHYSTTTTLVSLCLWESPWWSGLLWDKDTYPLLPLLPLLCLIICTYCTLLTCLTNSTLVSGLSQLIYVSSSCLISCLLHSYTLALCTLHSPFLGFDEHA